MAVAVALTRVRPIETEVLAVTASDWALMAVGTVKRTDATPEPLVTAVGVLSFVAPPLNATVTPGTGTPVAPVTVAVSVLVAPITGGEGSVVSVVVYGPERAAAEVRSARCCHRHMRWRARRTSRRRRRPPCRCLRLRRSG